jgi:N-acetylornithine carbamoyltransferase
MKNFLRIEDFSKEELTELLDLADQFEATPFQDVLRNKTLISMFFNPSTRTKVTFDLAMRQLGGHNIVIEPGKSSWPVEIEEGIPMDQEPEEHLKDATKVLNQYADALAVRCFPKFVDWKVEKKDLLIQSMAKWSSKPIINMETITHPCQALAMMKLIRDKFKKVEKKKFVLTWVYHPKGLNTAVANSAGMMASLFGMDVTIANPPGYDLDHGYLEIMRKNCQDNGADFRMVHDMDEAMEGADFVYAKSWGPLSFYGNFQNLDQSHLRDWIVNSERMKRTNHGYFSHCLPMRRNIKATDEVVDSKHCVIYEEAANRLHVQKAVLKKCLGDDEK